MALQKTGGFPGYTIDQAAESGLNMVDITLAANAGGGQANATLMDAQYNKVVTVATAGDSLKLIPANAAAIGAIQYLQNITATSANVFPNTGDQINALGANTAFAVAAGKSAIFICVGSGQWATILSA